MAMHRDINPSPPPGTTDGLGRNVIAVIGIDGYHHWPPLANAVNDATRAAAVFQQLGFAPIATLLNGDATRTAVQSLVTTDLQRLGPRDSLILFYAGHGITQEHRPGGDPVRTGYLVPVDATGPSADTSMWIRLEDWLRAIALLPARHILVILDACYSGIALGRSVTVHRGAGVASMESFAAHQARRSRVIITSTHDDQAAVDGGPRLGHSLFAGFLFDELEREIGRRDTPAITGSELGIFVQRKVRAYTDSRQTPMLGRFELDDGGEIAIPLGPDRFDHIAIHPPQDRVAHASPHHAPVPPRAVPVTRGVPGQRYLGSAVFFSIPDLTLMDGPTSHAAMTALHRVLRETFLENPSLGIRVLSSLSGAIVVVPDKARINLLTELIRAAQRITDAGVAFRAGLSRGELAMLVDADGAETAVSPVVNVAARLAYADGNDGILVDRSYQQHVGDSCALDHYLHPANCEKHLRIVKGKRQESFEVFAVPEHTVQALLQSRIAASIAPPTANAVMLAYDLANFSDGGASRLGARFRAVVHHVRGTMRIDPETLLFSPGGDGAVLVLPDADLEFTYPSVERLVLALADESMNMSPQAEVIARLGLHYGVVLLYESAEGVQRPTGPALFDTEEIAGDETAREYPGWVIISQPLLEFVKTRTEAAFQAIKPLTRAGRQIARSARKIQRMAMPAAAPSLRVATEAVIKTMRREDLPFIDDALELTPFESRGLSFEAVVEHPYSTKYEVPGDFTPKLLQRVRSTWLTGYDKAAEHYLSEQLEVAAKANEKDHECKIGFTAFDKAREARGTDTPPIGIRPVNNLVCQYFNIAIGGARVEPSLRAQVDARWTQWLENLLQGAFRMPCPSQLFLELVVITADGAIPRPVKLSTTSVYARRNAHAGVHTCGLEDGARWSNVVVHSEASRARVDFSDALLHGLAREYRILAAPTDSRGRPVGEKLIERGSRLLACRTPPRAGLFNLVVQGLHLNTAVLGYCVLPITRDALAEHLAATGKSGGLNFTNLTFITLDDCASVVADFEREIREGKPATEWHGTAIMRLHLATKHRATIDADLDAIRR
ncbi:MAG TPA: caspase family protein [Kofleriaceae bacterium]|jgi:hypothetical protein|nr:caspase family protein [Kofleriaceae bacterium]